MAQMRNDAARYGIVSITLHWLGALAILAMLATAGWIWNAQNDEVEGARIQLHASLGTLLYLVIAARILWSWIERKPDSLQDKPGLTAAARLVHVVLLLLVAAQLVTGPLNVWSGGWPVSAFGWFTIESPFDGPQGWHDPMGEFHSITGLVIAGLVTLHVLAALKHHFLDRDGTVLRMLGLYGEPDAESRVANRKAADEA